MMAEQKDNMENPLFLHFIMKTFNLAKFYCQTIKIPVVWDIKSKKA